MALVLPNRNRGLPVGDENIDVATEEDFQRLLEDARCKADDHWNTLLRTQAEMENLRKRHARDLENAHKFALEKFILEVLPVRDSMEMGIASMFWIYWISKC